MIIESFLLKLQQQRPFHFCNSRKTLECIEVLNAIKGYGFVANILSDH